MIISKCSEACTCIILASLVVMSETTLRCNASVTSQSRDGLHPAEVALIVVLILFPVIIAAAIIFWCYL